MYLCDLSALDKLIDLNNENTIVVYNNVNYSLFDLKDLLIDNNLSMSIDNHDIKIDGIYFNNKKIVSVVDLRISQKDDLINL